MTPDEIRVTRNFTVALRQLGNELTEQLARVTGALALASAVLDRAETYLAAREAELRADGRAAPPERLAP